MNSPSWSCKDRPSDSPLAIPQLSLLVIFSVYIFRLWLHVINKPLTIIIIITITHIPVLVILHETISQDWSRPSTSRGTIYGYLGSSKVPLDTLVQLEKVPLTCVPCSLPARQLSIHLSGLPLTPGRKSSSLIFCRRQFQKPSGSLEYLVHPHTTFLSGITYSAMEIHKIQRYFLPESMISSS